MRVYGLDDTGSPAWVDLDDVAADQVLRHVHGINGTGPTDVLGGSGELTISLLNGPENSVETRGAYSVGHASARVGFTDGAPVQVVYTYDGDEYIGWTGKLADSDPETGYYGEQLAHVVAYDYQHDLVDADVVEITPQLGQNEVALQNVLLDAVPADAQPPSRDLDAALDTYTYALYKLSQNTKCASALKDVLISGLSVGGCQRDGAYRYVNRSTRFTSTPIGSLDDTTLTSLGAPSRRSERANSVKCCYHPPFVDASDVVLFEQTGRALYVGPGQIVEDFTDYRNPDQTQQLIGAASHVAVDDGVDWVANDTEDGSGVDLTASIATTRDDFSTTSKWTFDNSGGLIGVWIVSRKVRGKGIYDDDAPVVESVTAQPYGKKVLPVDLPYQDDCRAATGIAELIRSQQETVGVKSAQAEFIANESDTLMRMALTAEFGDTVNITNANTGLVTQVMEIRRIEHELQPGNILVVRWDLAISSSLTDTPSAPTGLAVSTYSDTDLLASWTVTEPTAQTELYVDGNYRATVGAGVSSAILGGLVRATNYTVTAKHVKYALIRSVATAGVVGRPRVIATGGTTFDGALLGMPGYEFHQYFATSTIAIVAGGRVNMQFVPAGGGGGASDAVFIAGAGGGGGELLTILENVEPPGTYTVTIGAGGAGAVHSLDVHGANGGDTTYRSVGALGGGGGGSFFTSGGASSPGEPGGSGGGGSGEGGHGGAGNLGYAGGDGGAAGSGYRTGGGGGGAAGVGGAGVTGGTGSAVGGAGGSPVSVVGTLMGAGGQGGGPGGALGENATGYGNGGNGNINGDGGHGAPGFAQFWFLV